MITRMQTICTQCAHHIQAEDIPSRQDIWYNHLCGASPLPTKIDPVTGKRAHYDENSIGEGPTMSEFYYCRDVNKGNCPKFSPKK